MVQANSVRVLKALKVWEAKAQNAHPHLRIIAPNGSSWPAYSVTQPGLGHLVYHYIPLPVVESITANCERIFDSKTEFRRWAPEDRTGTIQSMAIAATARLLLDLPERISDAIRLTFEESLLYTETALQSAEAYTRGGLADATGSVEELANLWAEKHRQRLSKRLKRVGRTEVLTPTDDKRLPKITEGRLAIVYKQVKRRTAEGEKVQQSAVARKPGVAPRHLRRWCENELKLKTWAEVIDYLERT